MSMTSRLLDRAIELAQAGRTVEAHPLLLAVINAEPDNSIAWLWYVHVQSTEPERFVAVNQWLSITPDNDEAQKLYTQLSAALHTQNARVEPRSTTIRLVRLLLIILGILLAASVIYLGVVNDRTNRQLTDTTSHLETLRYQFDQLQQDYRNLTARYNATLSQYGALKSSYDRLNSNYQSTRDQLSALRASYDQLSADYQSARNQLADSQARFTALNSTYTALEEKAIVPPYIYVHGREVTIAFTKNDQTIGRWLVPMGLFERDITRSYTRQNVSLDNDRGTIIQMQDFRPFVEPEPWKTVITQLYNEAGNDDAFIREVWNIVTQLTQWTEDTMGETPRFPFDTLLAGGGDCEDTSILFASLIKAAPVNWEVALVYMDSDHPTDPQSVNHVIVRIRTGSNTYYIETTAPGEIDPYHGRVKGWPLTVN